MNYDATRALQLLRIGSGCRDASFREGQEDAIRHIVDGRSRLLVIQKTGWGKSFVYFIATKLLRESGAGPAMLISPLLALMRNQIAAAERMGVCAETINSENAKDWATVEAKLAREEIDILLISPERLAKERFRTKLADIAARISLLVIDEAHCISDWGHDFRPEYRLLERIVRTLPPNLRLLATTATANNRVMDDLAAVLGPNLNVSRGDLNRSSLTLQTIRLPSPAERLAWLAEQLATLQGSGIIYTLTIRDANQVADWLNIRGFKVEAYTSRTDSRRKQLLEQALLDNQVKALVATTALGMGYDKPDLAFVIHYQMPGSVVAYYQQVGRAGRALDAAYGVLLSSQEEERITDWFIRNAFPTRQEVADVLDALEEEPGGLSLSELLGRVNLSKGRIEKTIALLSLEAPAPIAKQDNKKWQLTAATLSEAFWDRAKRLTTLRRDEQQQMQDYVRLPFGQHMGFLIRALDGDPSWATAPVLPPLPTTVNDAELAKKAIAFLRRTSLSIEPRKKWPTNGGMPQYNIRGNIKAVHQAKPGRALCVWGDAGWGSLVRQGKYHDGRFSDELVAACVEMIRKWNPQPAPAWVTCVPSLRHPDLVPDFAKRLAAALRLPFHAVIAKTDDRPEQKTMANSTQQARNIDGSLALNDQPIPHGPVFLVDDMVDSRWTLTVSAWLLRQNGSGEVWPMALSQTGHDE